MEENKINVDPYTRLTVGISNKWVVLSSEMSGDGDIWRQIDETGMSPEEAVHLATALLNAAAYVEKKTV